MKRVTTILFLLLVASHALGIDPPPLGKPEARLILEAMDWREVTIIAIRQGVDAKGGVAPVYATAIGLGKCGGHYRNICQTLYFDAELEWHVVELSEKTARVWNKLGFHEIRPWTTW